jgi:hypothetical protein|tara:strand:- start:741 stop:1568 length:828 start_codon:yes stop_codon:yes gene_type:complete
MQLIKPNIGNYLSSLIAGGSQFRDLSTYCMFIGYPRSSHSLIGALLDAHPEMIIAHELNALDFLKKGYSRKQIFHLLLRQSKAFHDTQNEWMGYSYKVEGQWQGRYDKLKIIGDKRGGSSTALLKENPELLDKIKSFCEKFKVLHVIRNPYDNITTMIKRKEKKRNTTFNEADLHRKIDHYFDKTAQIEKIKTQIPDNILDIYIEIFIENPKAELSRICEFLEVEVNEDYLSSCADIVFNKSRKTRHNIDLWTSKNIEVVQKRIDQYDFLKHYSF